MTDQQIENNQNNDQNSFSWDETIRTVVFAVLIAVFFRSFAFEPFHIPSSSMKSNLLIGDYLFVSKYSYGYSRYSFPLGLPVFKGRILGSEPKRGDVLVFRPAAQPRIDFIKRVMGLPGDTIQMKEGILYINGNALPQKRVDDYTDEENKQNVHAVARYEQTLPEGKVITILKERNNDFMNNTPLFTVPAGHYFMMGDNRDNSHDSRFSDIGFVPAENIVGRAEVIFYSADVNVPFLINPVNWAETALRTERFFKFIH